MKLQAMFITGVILCTCVAICTGYFRATKHVHVDPDFEALDSNNFLHLSFDLGVLERGQNPLHRFRLTNPLGRPLTITAVQQSCGCQTCNVKKGYEIGSRASFEVEFSLSPDRRGKQFGELEIATDAIGTPYERIKLELRATLPLAMWTEPERLDFRQGETARLRLYCSEPQDIAMFHEAHSVRGTVRIIQVAAEKDYIEFDVDACNPLREGELFDVIVFRFSELELPLHQLNVRIDANPDGTEAR